MAEIKEAMGLTRTEDMLSRLKNMQHWNNYTALAEIGITSDTATIQEIWDALPALSIMSLEQSFITSWDIGNGLIIIVKRNSLRGGVFFMGKTGNNNDYRMFLDNDGNPDGIWYQYTMTQVNTTNLSEVADNERNE